MTGGSRRRSRGRAARPARSPARRFDAEFEARKLRLQFLVTETPHGVDVFNENASSVCALASRAVEKNATRDEIFSAPRSVRATD